MSRIKPYENRKDDSAYFYVDFIQGDDKHVSTAFWFEGSNDPDEFQNAVASKGLAFTDYDSAAKAARVMLQALNAYTQRISWKEAPSWANYLAQDLDGEWYWYHEKPCMGAVSWIPSGISTSIEITAENPAWRETLEERPQEGDADGR